MNSGQPGFDPEATPREPDARGELRGELRGVWAMWVVLILLLVFRPTIMTAIADRPALATWLTVFVSICLQALPFLVLGVALSAAIAAYLPQDALTRLLPRHPAAAVPVAALGGTVLPGCECASVPVAGALVRHGLPPGVALTFLLAAPAINPIVIVATLVAFPNQPMIAAARFVASLLVAILVGWIWLALGRDELIRMPHREPAHGSRLGHFMSSARHDFLHAGGFLVVGAAVASTVNVLVPPSWLAAVADHPVLSVLFMAGLAVVVAICSEADAFVAASLNQFSPVAQLVFMVVGPVLDVKLFSMQVGTFGHRFAAVFAPLTLAVAVGVAALIGWWLL